jgi:small neutral amino acid transporter SnatA (MarC family)
VAGFNKEKGRKALAWISFGFALVAGTAMAASPVGGWIRSLLGMAPGWVAALLLAAAVVSMAVDVFVDGEPNQLALYCILALPTLARATTGKLSANVTQASSSATASVNGGVHSWLGVSSTLGTFVICTVIALLMARRVIRKGR